MQKMLKKFFRCLQLLKSEGKTVIVSTHDLQIRELADQVFCLEDGRLAVKMSSAGFPVNDLLRRRLQTSLTIATLTLSVASTLFLLLFSNRLGVGLASATDTLTQGLTAIFSQFIPFIGVLIFVVGAVLDFVYCFLDDGSANQRFRLD